MIVVDVEMLERWLLLLGGLTWFVGALLFASSLLDDEDNTFREWKRLPAFIAAFAVGMLWPLLVIVGGLDWLWERWRRACRT